MKTQGRITLSLWSWRVSLEPFYKISQDIKYHVISYLSLSFINLNISEYHCISHFSGVFLGVIFKHTQL